MSHYCYHAGATRSHTIASPGPTEWPAGGAQLNARLGGNFVNQVWARLMIGSGTSGVALAEETVEYTTDLTGATGWTLLGTYTDGLTGPLVSVAKLGATGTHVGPWCPIAAGAKLGPVLTRVRGRNGDAATGVNTLMLQMETIGETLHAANSVTGGVPGAIGIVGGSQNAGGGTFGNGAGEFGTLAAGLEVIPSNVRVWRGHEDGASTLLTSISTTQHGVEAGVVKGLKAAGKAADIVCRYKDATDARYWIDTGLAVLKADADAKGVTIKWLFYVGGGNDGNSNATIGKYDWELLAFRGKVEQLFPGCAIVMLPQLSKDLINHAKTVEARVIVRRRMGEPNDGLCKWVDGTLITDTMLQADDAHPNSLGTVYAGELYIAEVLAVNGLG